MALYFETSTPNGLLGKFKKAIDEGRIITWTYDKDGDFTHATEQWKNKAWFRPRIENQMLAFYLIKPKNINISTEVYAIYHGRFSESMLAHFDSLFTRSIATAYPKGSDIISNN